MPGRNAIPVQCLRAPPDEAAYPWIAAVRSQQ